MNPNEFGFEDEMDADYREWKERVERIEENVRRVGRHDLDVLARVGVDRKSIVTLLALAAESRIGSGY
jgi:proline dehydrogenase